MGKRLTYKQVKEYVESFPGYKLLSTEYVDVKTKLELKCPEGHEFLIRYNDFQQGRRCSICTGNKKLTYEQVKEHIESFEGYKLLSKEYVNAKTKIEIQCPKNHTYKVTYGNFKSGYRCPICAGKIKLTYKYVKERIEKEGYKLLSKEYINVKTKLKLQCSEGHEFLMPYNSFQQGKRCPVCAGNIKLKYEYVKEYVESFEGYKLISEEYVNNHTKLEIQCPKGHIYNSIYSSFQKGQRCPVCAGNIKFTYEQVREYIESFEGYKLLSKEYVNSHTKLEIQCPEGHEFSMKYGHFQQGHRCPQCYALSTSSESEKEINEYVKSLTKKFILENDRNEIINPLTGYNLELDIYIPLLNKAIEFNGDYWHCNPDKYEADYWHIQKKMHAYQIWNFDKKKIELCKEKGIDLLTIWENDWNNKQEWCMELIKQHIERKII